VNDIPFIFGFQRQVGGPPFVTFPGFQRTIGIAERDAGEQNELLAAGFRIDRSPKGPVGMMVEYNAE